LPKVRFAREDVIVEAKAGQTLLAVAEAAGVTVFRGMWPELHCKRMPGWCNRCKVWVKPDAPNAINPPTSAEKFPLRIGGRVSGSQRLACQVLVNGDLTVHTRAGGPEFRPNVEWAPVEGPSKWKERWEKRHEGGGEEGEEGEKPKKKPAGPKAAAGGSENPAAGDSEKAPA
jgi:ferredoxin